MLVPLVAEVSDPTAMILAACGSAISVLTAIVLALVNARAGHLESTVKEHQGQINQLFIDKTRLEGETKTLRAEVDALKKETLTKELFEQATKGQNEKLDKVERKLEVIDRNVRPGHSQDRMPVPRSPIPRVDR